MRTPASRRPSRWLLLLGAPVFVIGVIAFGVVSGGKAAVSFALGFLAALAAASVAAVLVDIASRIAPGMGLMMAMLNYVLTVLFFIVLAMSVTSASVDRTGFALGLAAAVVPYVAWQFARAQRHVG
jgi:hypothetical protein